MKLTKAQRGFLEEIAFHCKMATVSNYKPALKLAELGLIRAKDRSFYRRIAWHITNEGIRWLTESRKPQARQAHK